MIIPIRCFTCGTVIADKIEYYRLEEEKLKKTGEKNKDELYKHFDKFHTDKILDKLELTRYCCRRNFISNVDMMNII